MDAIDRVAGRLMARPASPTADLYFVNACGRWLRPGGPVERLGPGVFASDAALLVVRHWGRARALPQRERLIWLIDDDVAAAIADTGLPQGNRLKLRLLEARHGARLRAAGARVVASSAALAERIGADDVLHPVWDGPLAGSCHHRTDGPLRIGYLGSTAHAGDLAWIAPALRAVLDAEPRAELHLAANHRSGPLAGHPRLRPIAATDWTGYRRWLRGARLHLAVYPMLETPVNRARSVSKIVEHAMAGAAALYPDHWPETARVVRRGAGAALPMDRDAWRDAALALLRDADRRRALAEGGRALAADLAHPGRQVAFWRHALAISGR